MTTEKSCMPAMFKSINGGTYAVNLAQEDYLSRYALYSANQVGDQHEWRESASLTTKQVIYDASNYTAVNQLAISLRYELLTEKSEDQPDNANPVKKSEPDWSKSPDDATHAALDKSTGVWHFYKESIPVFSFIYKGKWVECGDGLPAYPEIVPRHRAADKPTRSQVVDAISGKLCLNGKMGFPYILDALVEAGFVSEDQA